MPAKNPLAYAVKAGMNKSANAGSDLIATSIGGTTRTSDVRQVLTNPKHHARIRAGGFKKPSTNTKMTGTGAYAGASSPVPEKPFVPRDIVAGMGAGNALGGGMLNVAGSSLAGGMMGAMMSDRDNRGRGFIGGAMAGAAGGAMATAYSRHGAGMSNAAFGRFSKMFGKSETFQKHAGTMHRQLRGMHSSEGRNNMFRSGAMLSGGAFGLMFASNGRSHKRGFNRNRGNSFTR